MFLSNLSRISRESLSILSVISQSHESLDIIVVCRQISGLVAIDEDQFGMSVADLIRLLGAANVEARPVWKPMHTQPLYRGCKQVGGEVAVDLNRRGICLPSSSSLSEEEQIFIIERIRELHKSFR